MECKDSCPDLLKEVQSNIAVLQKAITEVGLVKASLKTTATDVKSQIRDSMSRHLEALRNRETWLLGQVEVVQHVKEDVLRQQQAELNKALGRLQTTCALLEQGGEAIDVESLECQLRESVEEQNLIPEETTVISFVARNLELQEAIHKLGFVISDNPVLDEQVAVSFQSLGLSTCKQDEAASSEKKCGFFAPSGLCEDWLVKKGNVSHSPEVPAVEFHVQDWLQKRQTPAPPSGTVFSSSPSQLSIKHWLSRCHAEVSTGEAESEMEAPLVKECGSEKDVTMLEDGTSAEQVDQEWLLKPSGKSMSAVKASNLFSYYQVVKTSDSDKWLAKSEKTTEELSTNLIGETYRRIAASGPSEWLVKKTPTAASSKISRSVSMLSCSDCSCGLSSSCPDLDSQEKSMEYDDASSVISDWLAVKKEDLETIAASSEAGDEVPDNDEWLMKCASDCSSSSTSDCTGIKRYKEQLDSDSNQLWLQHQGNNAPVNIDSSNRPTCTSGMKSYMESLPSDYNHWLSNPPVRSDICKWLARSSSDRCKNCPSMCSNGLFSIFGKVANTKEGWLMTPELF